jgi:hypothetical protein
LINPPTTSYILTFIKVLKPSKDKELNKKFHISLKNVIQLALFKFPVFSLEQSLPIIIGTVISSNLIIFF